MDTRLSLFPTHRDPGYVARMKSLESLFGEPGNRAKQLLISTAASFSAGILNEATADLLLLAALPWESLYPEHGGFLLSTPKMLPST